MAKQLVLVYGPSGTFKTCALSTFVTGMYRATGKRARLYNVDGGVSSIMSQVNAGLVELWEMSQHPHPFEALMDASRGYWPLDLSDPLSPLEPPYLVRYIAHCAACDLRVYDMDKSTQAQAPCTKCKAMLTIRPRNVYNPRNDLGAIGAVLYEGITGFAERLMDNMSDKSAKGEKIGEEVAIRFKDGNLDIGGVSRSSYGVAQRRPKRAVESSRLIPVPYVIWTAHKDRGEDSEKRVPVFGPKIAGHAATDDAPRWFGPCFSATCWPVVDKAVTRVERRLYLTNYYETFNLLTKDIEHICNSRIPPVALEGVPDYFVFDKTKKGEFGAETFLWDIVQLVETRQKQAAEMALKGVTK